MQRPPLWVDRAPKSITLIEMGSKERGLIMEKGLPVDPYYNSNSYLNKKQLDNRR